MGRQQSSVAHHLVDVHVLGQAREVGLAVGIRALDGHRVQIGHCRRRAPELFIRTRIPRKSDRQPAVANQQPTGRNTVIGSHRVDFQAFNPQRAIGRVVVQGQKGVLCRRDGGEVGPHRIVQDVVAQHLQHAGQPPSQGRRLSQTSDGVDHQRQTRDVVEVSVRQQDVLDAHHLGHAHPRGTRAGVDQHGVVDSIAGRPRVIAG